MTYIYNKENATLEDGIYLPNFLFHFEDPRSKSVPPKGLFQPDAALTKFGIEPSISPVKLRSKKSLILDQDSFNYDFSESLKVAFVSRLQSAGFEIYAKVESGIEKLDTDLGNIDLLQNLKKFAGNSDYDALASRPQGSISRDKALLLSCKNDDVGKIIAAFQSKKYRDGGTDFYDAIGDKSDLEISHDIKNFFQIFKINFEDDIVRSFSLGEISYEEKTRLLGKVWENFDVLDDKLKARKEIKIIEGHIKGLFFRLSQTETEAIRLNNNTLGEEIEDFFNKIIQEKTPEALNSNIREDRKAIVELMYLANLGDARNLKLKYKEWCRDTKCSNNGELQSFLELKTEYFPKKQTLQIYQELLPGIKKQETLGKFFNFLEEKFSAIIEQENLTNSLDSQFSDNPQSQIDSGQIDEYTILNWLKMKREESLGKVAISTDWAESQVLDARQDAKRALEELVDEAHKIIQGYLDLKESDLERKLHPKNIREDYRSFLQENHQTLNQPASYEEKIRLLQILDQISTNQTVKDFIEDELVAEIEPLAVIELRRRETGFESLNFTSLLDLIKKTSPNTATRIFRNLKLFDILKLKHDDSGRNSSPLIASINKILSSAPSLREELAELFVPEIQKKLQKDFDLNFTLSEGGIEIIEDELNSWKSKAVTPSDLSRIKHKLDFTKRDIERKQEPLNEAIRKILSTTTAAKKPYDFTTKCYAKRDSSNNSVLVIIGQTSLRNKLEEKNWAKINTIIFKPAVHRKNKQYITLVKNSLEQNLELILISGQNVKRIFFPEGSRFLFEKKPQFIFGQGFDDNTQILDRLKQKGIVCTFENDQISAGQILKSDRLELDSYCKNLENGFEPLHERFNSLSQQIAAYEKELGEQAAEHEKMADEDVAKKRLEEITKKQDDDNRRNREIQANQPKKEDTRTSEEKKRDYEEIFKDAERATKLLKDKKPQNSNRTPHISDDYYDPVQSALDPAETAKINNKLSDEEFVEKYSQKRESGKIKTSAPGASKMDYGNSPEATKIAEHEIGEVLNSSDNLRVRTGVVLRDVVNGGEKEEIYLSQNLRPTTTQLITEQGLDHYKEQGSNDKIFSKINRLIQPNQTYRLSSPDPSDLLRCVILYDENQQPLADGATEFSKLQFFRGDDDFFYVSYSGEKNLILSYIIESPSTFEQESGYKTIKNNTKNIIDDYLNSEKFSFVASPENLVPDKSSMSNDEWMKRVYDDRLGSCRHRVAAVEYKLKTTPGIDQRSFRAVNIDNNHIILELKNDDGKWHKVDLGGAPTRTIDDFQSKNNFDRTPGVNENKLTTKEEEFLRKSERPNESDAQKLKEFIQTELKESNTAAPAPILSMKENSSAKEKEGSRSSSFDEKKSSSKEVSAAENHPQIDQNKKREEIEEVSKQAKNFAEKIVPEVDKFLTELGQTVKERREQITKENTKEVVEKIAQTQQEKKLEEEAFTQKKYTDFTSSIRAKETLESVQNEEVLAEKIANNKNKKLLIVTKNITENSNFIFALHRNSNASIYYIDSPSKIDINQDSLLIENETSVSLRSTGHLDDFLQNAAANPDKKHILMIDWDAFSASKRVALNTIIDEGSRSINGVEIPKNVQVIGFAKEAFRDSSFLSRNDEVFESNIRFDERNEDEPNSAITQIDLEGFDNVKRKLFGRLILQGESIIWQKSDFVKMLESGENNFEFTNLSNEAKKELEYFFDQAKSAGYLQYHGYEVKISPNFHFGFSPQQFDFPKFNDPQNISVVKDAKYSSALKDYHTINQHLFDALLYQKNIDNKTGQYDEFAGLISGCPEINGEKTLQLFVTHDLGQSQYYALLNEAKKHNVKLDLALASGVELPDGVRYREKFLNNYNADKADLVKLVISQNPDEYVSLHAESGSCVVDVEDPNYQDLVERESYEKSENAFKNFRKIESEIITKLRYEQKVILKGEFSDDLLQMLEPIILGQDERFAEALQAGNLIFVIESSKNKNPSLNYLDESDYEIDEKSSVVNSETSKIFEEPEPNNDLDLENSAQNSLDFIERRKTKFVELLQDSSMLRLIGHSGVGKSQLLKAFGVHSEMTNFRSWAENKTHNPILFIDEANIEESHLTTFSILKKPWSEGEKTREIFYQGEFFEITPNHKVVFASNPNSYGGGRNEQKLFADGAIPEMHLKDFPASYIYEEILKKALYQADIKDEMTEDAFKEICRNSIKNYQIKNQQSRARKDQDSEMNELTVRELQEEVLREFLKREEIAIFGGSSHPEISSKQFLSVPATKEAEKALLDSLEIRQRQRSGSLTKEAVGLNGIIFKGDPGVGKSAMIQAILEKEEIPQLQIGTESDFSDEKGYYKIDANLPFKQKCEIIKIAYEKGRVIWIDELNSCVDEGLEKILNSALTGKHPDGRDELKPESGFMMISSVNSAGLEGRKMISPALLHRSVQVEMKPLREYGEEDFAKLIKHWIDEDQINTSAVNDISHCVSMSQKDFIKILNSPQGEEVNLRMLRKKLPEILTIYDEKFNAESHLAVLEKLESDLREAKNKKITPEQLVSGAVVEKLESRLKSSSQIQ